MVCFLVLETEVAPLLQCSPFKGADPGFLERGFICIKGVGLRFADFISFFLNIP